MGDSISLKNIYTSFVFSVYHRYDHIYVMDMDYIYVVDTIYLRRRYIYPDNTWLFIGSVLI